MFPHLALVVFLASTPVRPIPSTPKTVTLPQSFERTVVQGLSVLKESILGPDFKLESVSAERQDGVTARIPEELSEIKVEMMNIDRTVELSTRYTDGKWEQPQKSPNYWDMPSMTWTWTERSMTLKEAFKLLRNAGYNGPVERVKIVKPIYDLYAAGGPNTQIYYVFTIPDWSQFYVVGATDRKVRCIDHKVTEMTNHTLIDIS